MRRSVRLLSLLLLVSASFYACTATKNIDISNIPPNTVIMANTKFYPATITVPRGTTVTWRNDEDMTHNAIADDKSFETGDMKVGELKTITFDKPGIYPYHCSHHTFLGLGMNGTIIVQ